jgi:hypothetical protein
MTKGFAKIFGLIASVLLAFTLIGVWLPGTWSAKASIKIPAPPRAIFPLIVDLDRWNEWTQWGDVQSTTSDPSYGQGAFRTWDNDQYGSGSITIIESYPEHALRYRVVVDKKSEIIGNFNIEPSKNGSTITWNEEGDFGNNPLMGYVAITMSKSQGKQLFESLGNLKQTIGK